MSARPMRPSGSRRMRPARSTSSARGSAPSRSRAITSRWSASRASNPPGNIPTRLKLDGAKAWPPPGYEFPTPRIRPIPRDGTLRLLFGSCRASAPHRPPHTFQRWYHPKGQGIDVLRTYAMRMLRQPSSLWPDALMMMGDQLYADQVPAPVEEIVGDREVHENGPVRVLEDFEEYTVGYWDAWSHPYVRWLLSTLPSSMIFDDHEINDKWKTSQAWLDEKRQTEWYADRVIGGLMAYWIYQHLGNLSPAELAEDETYQALCAEGDGDGRVRRMATDADEQTGHSRFSFCRDLGPARLIMLDSRAGRQLEPGNRRIMSDEEWQWVTGKVDGDHRHLLMASSLPFLLPAGMHHVEGWSEALTRRRLGRALHRPRREGPDRRQPRPLGLLPQELRQVRGAGRRHRHRRLRRAAGLAAALRRRRPPLLGHRGGAARGRGRVADEDLADGLLGAAQGPAGQRADRPPPRPHPRRRHPRLAARAQRRVSVRRGCAGAPSRARTSAIRRGRWRSPAARSGCGSSVSRAVGASPA